MSAPEPDVAAIMAAAARDGLSVEVAPAEAVEAAFAAPPEPELAVVRPMYTLPDPSAHVPPFVAPVDSAIEQAIEQRVQSYRERLHEAVRARVADILDAVPTERPDEPTLRTGPTPAEFAASMARLATPAHVAKAGVHPTHVPGTCVVVDGAHLRCHHGVSWLPFANTHSDGLPTEGFECEICMHGECSAFPTFPIHE